MIQGDNIITSHIPMGNVEVIRNSTNLLIQE